MNTFRQIPRVTELDEAAYTIEILQDQKWIHFDNLVLLNHGGFVGGNIIKNLEYHRPTASLNGHFIKDGKRYTANIFIAVNQNGFIGTLSEINGESLVVRGAKSYSETFKTVRCLLKHEESEFSPWLDLSISSSWVFEVEGEQPQLIIRYMLGEFDISNRVRVTHVDHKTGVTTLEMVQAILLSQMTFDPIIDQAHFKIDLQFGGEEFNGKLNIDDKEYKWNGLLKDESKENKRKFLMDNIPSFISDSGANISASSMEQRSETKMSGETLSVQDLDNVNSITVTINDEGDEVTYDAAQSRAGEFFNKGLINGLEEKWLKKLFGKPYNLPEKAEEVFQKNKPFFADNSVLGTGQLLYGNLKDNADYEKVMKKVDPEALEARWETLGQSQDSAPEYQKVTNQMYIQGYRYAVPGIQAYLKDDPYEWGDKYYKYLVSESTLLTWQIQIASAQFTNTTQRMYEWFTKMSILSPEDSSHPEDMLSTVFSALLGVQYTKVLWDEKLSPIMEQVIENAINGSYEEFDDFQKEEYEKNKKVIQEMIEIYGGDFSHFARQITYTLTNRGLKTLEKSVFQWMGDELFIDTMGSPLSAAKFKQWEELTKTKRGFGILKGIGWAFGAGAVIYGIFNLSKKPQDFNVVVTELSLGAVGINFMVRGIQNLMDLGIGSWMRRVALQGDSGLASFAGDLAQWFSKDSRIVAQSRAGKFFTKILGKNSGEFFLKRMGPAFAIFGVVLTSSALVRSIQNGDIPNIIFDSLNVFFALAEMTLLFLQIGGVAWAGPVGLAVAAIGIVIIIVQTIFNWLRPKPNPVKDFVEGPMKEDNLLYT
ncbi:hypothetical protein O1C50_002362 [Vibrio cholerae]|nr:hypothetical protein [Vibrio cholerae]